MSDILTPRAALVYNMNMTYSCHLRTIKESFYSPFKNYFNSA